MCGIPAVTFNPLGTAQLLNPGEQVDSSDIINYCNPRDWTPSRNSNDFIGKCYEVNSKGGTSNKDVSYFEHHNVETMEDLRTRKPSIKQKLLKKYEEYQKSTPKYLDTAIEAFKETFSRHSQLNKNNPSSGCTGSYPVSGYTREDGTKVNGYTRSCGANHSSDWRGKRLDQMTDLEVNQMLDDLI